MSDLISFFINMSLVYLNKYTLKIIYFIQHTGEMYLEEEHEHQVFVIFRSSVLRTPIFYVELYV